MPPDHHDEIHSFLHRIEQGEVIEHFETVRITKAGRPVDVSLSISPLMNPAGHIYGAATIARDITERKKIELTLRHSEERFVSLFQASPSATFLSRKGDSLLVDVNEAALEMFGYSREEVIGHTSQELEMWSNSKEFQLSRERLLGEGGSVQNQELSFLTRTKSLRLGLVSAKVIQLDGEPHILTTLQDITERRAAEELLQQTKDQLRQSQKMEAIGRVAGGVAHDFNNILTGIMGNAELMLLRIDALDPLVHNVEEIIKEVEQAGALTHQLLAVSRSQVVQPKVLNLNDLVGNILQLLRRVIGEDIELVTHLTDERIKS